MWHFGALATCLMKGKRQHHSVVAFVFLERILLYDVRRTSLQSYLLYSTSNSTDMQLFFCVFSRDSDPTRYEIKADLSLEKPGILGPPFNFTFNVSHRAPHDHKRLAQYSQIRSVCNSSLYSVISPMLILCLRFRFKTSAPFLCGTFSWTLTSLRWRRMEISFCR